MQLEAVLGPGFDGHSRLNPSRPGLLVLLRDHPGGREARQRDRDAAGLAAVHLGRLLARNRLAHHMGAEEAHGIGREAALQAVDETAGAPLVGDAERERREDAAADDARARRRCPRSRRRRRCACGRRGGRRSGGPCACGRSGRTSRPRSARRRASGRPRAGCGRRRWAPSSRSKRGPMRSCSAMPQPPLPKTMRPSSVVR